MKQKYGAAVFAAWRQAIGDEKPMPRFGDVVPELEHLDHPSESPLATTKQTGVTAPSNKNRTKKKARRKKKERWEYFDGNPIAERLSPDGD